MDLVPVSVNIALVFVQMIGDFRCPDIRTIIAALAAETAVTCAAVDDVTYPAVPKAPRATALTHLNVRCATHAIVATVTRVGASSVPDRAVRIFRTPHATHYLSPSCPSILCLHLAS